MTVPVVPAVDVSREKSYVFNGGFNSPAANPPLHALLVSLEASNAGTIGTELSLSKS